MNVLTESENPTSLATRLAPEDIRPEDMVAVLSQILELPSFFWNCSSALLAAEELVRLKIMPSDPGKPFQVVSVCLPFVYAKDIKDKLVVFDTRRHQLVRLDKTIARKVRKKMRKAAVGK